MGLQTIALIALTTLAVSACASGPQRREVDLDVLWYNSGDKTGGFSRAVVSVEPNPSERIRVGVIEESALQLGDLWRTSIWLAAFQASLALSRPLNDWLVLVELDHRGRGMDGPSAGALLTAGMLAGMTGATVNPEFTMTGTINPDGSIGPVSGIPQKFRAAMAGGKRLLGFPLGQDQDVDLKTGQSISVLALADQGAAVIREVPDIETAYEMMTGRTLARPALLAVKEMSLPAKVKETLVAQTAVWLRSAEQNFQQYNELKLQDPWLKDYWNNIDQAFGEAVAATKRGETVAAYFEAASLFIDADSALLHANILKRVRDGRFEEAAEYLTTITNNVDQRLGGLVKKLKGDVAHSTSDLMTLVDAFEAFGSGVRYFGAALSQRSGATKRIDEILVGLRQKSLTLTPELQAEFIDLLREPVRDISLANVHAIVCEQNLGFRPEVAPESKEISRAFIDRLGTLFHVAGNTNLSYFETLVLQSIADANAVSREKVRQNFTDPTYQHVREGPRAMMESILEGQFGRDTNALSLVKLSTALNTYVSAAFLVAKYYSLDANVDAGGAVKSLGREAVLVRMLALAETKALEHAARAKKVAGEVPVAARIAFDAGRDFAARGTLHARLSALEQFWRASMLSQMAVLLRG